MEPEKTQENVYIVEKEGSMNVPVKIFASERILKKIKNDRCIDQAINVAALPGIRGYSYMMPDAHQGYGFSIGGVAALDETEGCLSPGGVGFDINCGVRALHTDIPAEEFRTKMQEVMDRVFKAVPVGVGRDSDIRLSLEQLDEVCKKGARWAVENGYGTEEDIELCEEQGCMQDADPAMVSQRAKQRGKSQLGTLGAGNHFIEFQVVDRVQDEKAAEVFGIKRGNVVVMIHSGSRGFGHQICSDYVRKIEERYSDIVSQLPEKDLAYAPAGSELADGYYRAMCCAMNFAWANRQIMAARIRDILEEMFGADVCMIYDMSHNNAKLEEHVIDGKRQRVWVHRKGAARAFPPGHPDIPEKYQKSGQPVIIPGSMGTASYILAGTESAMEQSLGTTCHGAGRVMSRKAASRMFSPEEVEHDLSQKNITLRAGSRKGVVDEAPGVYKDVDEVVEVCAAAGLARIVAKLRPIGVIKG